MLTSNPFAELSALIPPTVMQVYVVIMIILVAGGTLFDILHKKSAKYFFNNWRKAKNSGARQVGGGEAVSLAVRTVVVEGLMSGEFCNARRRIAHLLTMYGFLAYVITTAVMVFWYATPEAPGPAILPLLWWIGGLLICIGGYWFWFFIRVDVVAEGNSPFRVVRADPVYSFPSRECDTGPDLGLRAGKRQCVDKLVVWFIRDRHDGALRIYPVVKILTYVLQACSRSTETDGRGRRFKKQLTGTCR